jgi:hypothetical protein
LSGWKRLTYDGLKRVYKPEQVVVLIVPTGQCYVGHISELTQKRVELINGDHHITVYYEDRLVRYSLIDPPAAMKFSRGESQGMLIEDAN